MHRFLRGTCVPAVLVAGTLLSGCDTAPAGGSAAPRLLKPAADATPLRPERYPLPAPTGTVVPVALNLSTTTLESPSGRALPRRLPVVLAAPGAIRRRPQAPRVASTDVHRMASPPAGEGPALVPAGSAPARTTTPLPPGYYNIEQGDLSRLPMSRPQETGVPALQGPLSHDHSGGPPPPNAAWQHGAVNPGDTHEIVEHQQQPYRPPSAFHLFPASTPAAPPGAAPNQYAGENTLHQGLPPAGDSRSAEAQVAMQAVSERARQLVDEGVGLACRGAYYSARSDFIEALRTVAQALDMLEATQSHTQALGRGLRAMDEAKDFVMLSSQSVGQVDLNNIVSGHRTPVLQDADLTTISPLMASQQYYSFAQQQLADAAGRESAGSLALYTLGRLNSELGKKSPSEMRTRAPKAMTLFQAALMVDQRNHLAANELGVLLARYGQLHDARQFLLHSVTLRPSSQVWSNLATVHERLGEADLAQRARNEQRIASRTTGGDTAAAGSSMVRWVSPNEFGRLPASAAPDGAAPDPKDSAAPRTKKAEGGDRVGHWWLPWQRQR